MAQDKFTFLAGGRARCLRTRQDGSRSAAGVYVSPFSVDVAKAALIAILDAMDDLRHVRATP